MCADEERYHDMSSVSKSYVMVIVISNVSKLCHNLSTYCFMCADGMMCLLCQYCHCYYFNELVQLATVGKQKLNYTCNSYINGWYYSVDSVFIPIIYQYNNCLLLLCEVLSIYRGLGHFWAKIVTVPKCDCSHNIFQR